VDLDDLVGKAVELFDRDDPDKIANRHYKKGISKYKRGDFGEAEALWRSAAIMEHAKAMYMLGYLKHRQGEDDEAGYWFVRAARCGNVGAMYNLGALRHKQGKDDEAEQWLRMGAEVGDADSMHMLAFMLHGQGKEGEAEQWRRKAAAAARRPMAWHEGSGMQQGWYFGWKWEKSGGTGGRYAKEMGGKAADLADDVARGNRDFGPG
jgi:TPR repeat protein